MLNPLAISGVALIIGAYLDGRSTDLFVSRTFMYESNPFLVWFWGTSKPSRAQIFHGGGALIITELLAGLCLVLILPEAKRFVVAQQLVQGAIHVCEYLRNTHNVRGIGVR